MKKKAVPFKYAGSHHQGKYRVTRTYHTDCSLHCFIAFFSHLNMASMIALLAATATLFSCARAFSPDQCNATSYGAPDRTACNTLMTSISKLGTGNASYLFIPSQFATPEGLSNGTRKNFPQTWTNSKFLAVSVGIRGMLNHLLVAGCRAALVPIAVTTDSVTYDTSTYQDLATSGRVVIQECLSNKTVAGGWELAGRHSDGFLFF